MSIALEFRGLRWGGNEKQERKVSTSMWLIMLRTKDHRSMINMSTLTFMKKQREGWEEKNAKEVGANLVTLVQ
jgi:hypothetical protein